VVAIAAAVCVGLMIDGGGDAGRRIRDLLAGTAPRLRRDGSAKGAAA
jgi:hypothetical protein